MIKLIKVKKSLGVGFKILSCPLFFAIILYLVNQKQTNRKFPSMHPGVLWELIIGSLPLPYTFVQAAFRGSSTTASSSVAKPLWQIVIPVVKEAVLKLHHHFSCSSFCLLWMEEGGLGYFSSGNGHIKTASLFLLCFPLRTQFIFTILTYLCWNYSAAVLLLRSFPSSPFLARRPTPQATVLCTVMSVWLLGPADGGVFMKFNPAPWAINTRCAHKCTANTGQTPPKNPS